MTNNINGIDVSECAYFIDHTPPKGQGDWCGAIHKGACKVYSKDCEYNNNCYYKQLKRLQEENKSLQMLSCANCGEKYLSPDGSELYDENVRLQKENEELKNRLKTLDDEEFVYEVTEIEYNNFKKMNEYKQALEEIREIAKHWLNNDWSCYHCRSNMDEKLKEIIKLTRC